MTLPAQVPGCRNGRLEDPKAYFFALIGRAEGAPAPDWQAVLTASGLLNGPPPGIKPNPTSHYGITQQIGAGGVRGRLMLPTDTPDDLGYYAHPIDVLVGDPLRWAWNDWIGGPPYAPQPCGSADDRSDDRSPVVPVPSVDLTPVLKILGDLQQQVLDLQATLAAVNRHVSEISDRPPAAKVEPRPYPSYRTTALGVEIVLRPDPTE